MKAKKLSKPTVAEKHKRVVKRVIENGGNVTKAMREEGYSEAYVHNPQKLTGSKSFKELMDEFLPEDELVQVHKNLLKSKRVEKLVVSDKIPDDSIAETIREANCTLKKIYKFMGEKTVLYWAPNDKSRTDALDLAYRLRGSYSPEKHVVETKISNLSDEELDQLIEEETKKIAK